MILASMFALRQRLVRTGQKVLTEDDSYISYLPGAHSFEQGLICMSVCFGCKMGFYGGNPLNLIADIGVLKPTFFPSVPRVYNKIYGKIQD